MEHQLTEIEELESIYCDMHKDAYGVKARWIKFGSVEAGRKALDELQLAVDAEMENQRRSEEVHAHLFERRVESLIVMGAKDRETAMRWIHQAENTDGDDEYLCYSLGLRYGYFKKVA